MLLFLGRASSSNKRRVHALVLGPLFAARSARVRRVSIALGLALTAHVAGDGLTIPDPALATLAIRSHALGRTILPSLYVTAISRHGGCVRAERIVPSALRSRHSHVGRLVRIVGWDWSGTRKLVRPGKRVQRVI